MAPKFRPAVASQSFGRTPHHRIEEKLSLCVEYGFEAIEIFMEDLELVATTSRKQTDSNRSEDHNNSLLAASKYVGQLCRQHNLTVICLQPFANYEGLLDRSVHASRIQELHLWIRLAQNLGTDLIQIPSTYLPANECSSSRELIISDLREACDIGLTHTPPIRFAHEALAWATHHSLWTDVWDMVLAVDRSNFGTCLDTFNLLGREYADPASPSGKTTNAESQLATTLHNLRTRLIPEKIFYIEAVDGERLSSPLIEGHEFYNPEQPARMSWSRNARLFPCEEGGYLPVLQVLKAIEDAGYQGWVSFEFFSRTAHEQGKEVPREHARRAQRSWKKLCEAMGWQYLEEWGRGDGLTAQGTGAGTADEQVSTSSTPQPATSTKSMTLPVSTVKPVMPFVSRTRPEPVHRDSWTTATVLQAH